VETVACGRRLLPPEPVSLEAHGPLEALAPPVEADVPPVEMDAPVARMAVPGSVAAMAAHPAAHPPRAAALPHHLSRADPSHCPHR